MVAQPSEPSSELSILLSAEQITLLRDRAETTRKLYADLLFSLAKWLLAGMLTINSAGIVAAFSAAAVTNAGKVSAVTVFVIGVLAALLSGFTSLLIFVKFMPQQGALMRLEPGEYTIAYLEEITSGPQAAAPHKDPIVLFGLLSVALFVAGCAALALNLKP